MQQRTERRQQRIHDYEAAGTAAIVNTVIDGKLRDFEVLSTRSDPVDKILEAANKEQTADTTTGTIQCILGAAMLAAEATDTTAISTKIKGAAIAVEPDGGGK